jgi:hypothetical protein
MMADERCRHDLLPGQCGDCEPRPADVPRMVWITEGGAVHHRSPHCEALLAGQGYAEQRGQQTHEPEQVAYTTARASGRGACLHCFPVEIPVEIPPDAKPCAVRVGDRWIEGWLLKWFRGDDQQWKGAVSYIDMDWHRPLTITKDESDLKPLAAGTNDPGQTGD